MSINNKKPLLVVILGISLLTVGNTYADGGGGVGDSGGGTGEGVGGDYVCQCYSSYDTHDYLKIDLNATLKSSDGSTYSLGTREIRNKLEGNSGEVEFEKSIFDLPIDDIRSKFSSIDFNYHLYGTKTKKVSESTSEIPREEILDRIGRNNFQSVFSLYKDGTYLTNEATPSVQILEDETGLSSQILRNGESSPLFEYRVDYEKTHRGATYTTCDNCGNPTLESQVINGSGYAKLWFRVFKEAQSVFGLQTKAIVTKDNKQKEIVANKKPNLKSEYYNAEFGTDYYDSSVNNELGGDNHIALDKDNGELDMFMGSNLDYNFDLRFIHNVYRGLNTRYESYFSDSRTIATPYSLKTYDGDIIKANAEKNPNSRVESTAPDDTSNHKTSFNNLDKETVREENLTIKNDDIELGTFRKEYCETLRHPLVTTTLGNIESDQTGWHDLDFTELKNGVGNSFDVKYQEDFSNASLAETGACIYVYRPYNFDLIPRVETPSGNILYPDDNISVSVPVENTPNKNPDQEGNPSYSPEGTTMKVFTFILDADVSLTDTYGGEVDFSNIDEEFCGYAESFILSKEISSLGDYIKTSNCHKIAKTNGKEGLKGDEKNGYEILANGDIIFKNGIPYNSKGLGISFDYKIPIDLDAGTKICFASAINFVDSNYNPTGNGLGYGEMNGNRWRISNISCRPVAIKPTVQILGGDVFANGNILASESTFGGISFGSWTDYGLISNGYINNLASGSYGATGRSSNSPCAKSPMTIANNDACKSGNDLNTGYSGISLNASFVEKLLSKYDSVNKINNANYIKEYGNKKISDMLGNNILDSGTQIIIVEGGNLVIDTSLFNSDQIISDISNVPQRIIIVKGGDIYISEDATRVDAWLVAPDGTINTCISRDGVTIYDIGKNGISANSRKADGICSKQLNINGVVIANSIKLTRTYFSTDPNMPNYAYNNYAERIQLPFSSIMWAYDKIIRHSRTNYSINYLRELAPRY